ncbi:hypothetical protein VTL71DRAFT_5969 [Oculimacula yallundae]|uniref:Uncharacterized protein n=1 Tax=Oculimacula yallundae TaxID=86028 RepID=A0ABR4C003_9HELO
MRLRRAAVAPTMEDTEMDDSMEDAGGYGSGYDDNGVRLRGGAKTKRKAKAMIIGGGRRSKKSAGKADIAASLLDQAGTGEVTEENYDIAESKRRSRERHLKDSRHQIQRTKQKMDELQGSDFSDPIILNRARKLEEKLANQNSSLQKLENSAGTKAYRAQISRDKQAARLFHNIQQVERELAVLQSSESPTSKNEIQKLEQKLSKNLRTLRKLEFLGASGHKAQLGSEVAPWEYDMDSEQEATDDDDVPNPRKRRLSNAGFQDNEDNGETSITERVVVIDDTPKIKKEKKEKEDKKDKKHKKRKTDHTSQESTQSTQVMENIPDFESQIPNHISQESTQPTQVMENIPDFESQMPDHSNEAAVSARKKAKQTMQDEAEPPTPEQAKQSALIDTITRQRSRSDPSGADRIYKALLASIGACPSPPSPGRPEPSAEQHSALIEIGKLAMAAPIIPSKQKPIRDRAFVAQPHRESPILPPTRKYSLPKQADPITDRIQVEKPKKRIAEGKKSRKEKVILKAAEESQESEALSQTVAGLKEKTSASVGEGLFSQADPVTSTGTPSTTRILPPVKISIPKTKVMKHPNDIQSATPVTTPTKPKKAKRAKGAREESEDWETEPGKIHARIPKESRDDDVETEEISLSIKSDIAFSSTYISARPLGICISGTKFQVLRIASGEEHELPICTDKGGMRICSIAQGRVRVSLGGKMFTIGENGMWRVRSGEKCVVANQNVIGSQEAVAYVHISAIEG